MSIPEGVFIDHPTVVSRARFPGKEGIAPKTLHYFCIRALGDLPRLMLEYTETPYDAVMYFIGGNYKAFAPFGQMPCYQGPELSNGEMYLAQSSSICRHIAEETGIYGSSKEARAVQDMLWECGKDIASKTSMIHAEGDVDERFDGLLQGVMKMLKESHHLSDSPGFGEIGVFHALNNINDINPKFLDKYGDLKKFVEKVSALPTVSAFLKSPRHLPLTENEMGKGHTGLTGYKYTSPLNPETVAEVYTK